MSDTEHSLLNQRVAVVTGASAGIGQAIARTLCRVGMRVVAGARRIERLHALRDELGAERLLPVQVDLRDEAQIMAMFEATESHWGGLDVLVNNAGLGHEAPLSSGATEHWREMLEVNVLALCVCTREAIKSMNARGVAGHIVHVSSMSGHRVPAYSGVYSATKYAVRSLTEGLRLELREAKSDIRVTAVSPGTARTEFAAHYLGSEEEAEQNYSRFPPLTSEDVANAVLYALEQPPNVEVHDILMRPVHQAR